MHFISMKELREDFEKVKQGLEKGEKFCLVYRSKILAEIRPVKQK